MILSATIRGADALSLKAKYLIRAAQWGLEAGVSEGAFIFEQEAQTLAPRDTGALADSIHTEDLISEGDRQVKAVRVGVDYGSFVEYGTGLRGAAAPHPPLPTQGVPFTGSWVYDYQNQGWIGQVAQPFMRPAFDGKRAEVESTIKKSVLAELAGAASAQGLRKR
jgi:HK97 gp10 family phage protein